MESLLKIITENEAIKKFENNNGRLVLNDNLSLAYLVSSSFKNNPRNICIVASNLYTAQNIYEQITSLIGEDNCLLFPVDEIYQQNAYSYSKEILAQRLFVMNKCLNNHKSILITHVDSINRQLPNPQLYIENTLNFKKNHSYKINEIVSKLINMSFTRVNKIDQSLQFALRGDILDIFPINYESPIRIEFFDDEIESIRFFDIASQTSNKELEEISIFPSSDLLFETIDETPLINKLNQDLTLLSPLNQDNLKKEVYNSIDKIKDHNFDESTYKYYHYFNKEKYNILDYFSPDCLLLYKKEDIDASIATKQKEFKDYIDELFSNGLSLLDYNINLNFEYSISKCKNIITSHTYFLNDDDYTLDIKTIPFYSRNLINSITLIQEYLFLNNKIIICLNEKYLNSYQEFLKEKEIDFELINKDELPEKNIGLCLYDLESGFELSKEKIVILTKREIFGYKQNLTVFSSRYKKAQVLNSFEELNTGDYIVHEENGIGRYEGIVTLTVNNQIGDYLKIMYANEQILYVPLQQFSRIRKYVSSEGAVPRLSHIGGKDWANTKKKIKEQVNYLAERLIALYAKREITPGYAFKKDDEFMKEFEDSFPYKLTIDQEKAIKDIKEDMEKATPMDRLICGDVGFGKTEVAFRAAFKAILSGKQVALLCPTTILAKQHFDVASSRFAMFGVKICLFSRFVSEKVQKENIKEIEKGNIHLIIGTHRLLSKEINIPNLGLLIVDEEQRFGVEHKERIKEIANQVDVLTLSATPIPRTLQMSLLGIRNLSQLQTPPHARMPIQTYVTPYDPRLVKEVIGREFSRGGQVYYLHNRVSSIYQKAQFIINALPQARVGIVHAKMDKNDIDEVMSKFYLGEIDVLVCTSIVEAGLDVSNANTIIIENADMFGLSQLYQIKGRVGRSNRVSYAYLFYNDKKELNDVAQKRLKAIKEFTELGSGIKIAQRDLNIRGAGDILGSEQSGFINTVGMDMYVSILNEVIAEKKGQEIKQDKIKVSNITIGGYIPSTYALDSDKIQLYQEIEACNTIAKIEIFKRRIRDIYGRIPSEVNKIILKRKIDILASSKNIESLFEEETINLTLTSDVSKKNGLANLMEHTINLSSQDILIKFIDKKLIFKIKKNKNAIDNLLTILEFVNTL